MNELELLLEVANLTQGPLLLRGNVRVRVRPPTLDPLNFPLLGPCFGLLQSPQNLSSRIILVASYCKFNDTSHDAQVDIGSKVLAAIKSKQSSRTQLHHRGNSTRQRCHMLRIMSQTDCNLPLSWCFYIHPRYSKGVKVTATVDEQLVTTKPWMID